MFGLSVMTSNGAALCRQAAEESKKIVFTRAYCGPQYETDRGDLASKDLSWFSGSSGTVSAVSTALGFLQVCAAFAAVDEGTDPVKSVCLCAQLASDDADPEYSEDDDVIFAACSDDNSAYISGNAFAVPFSLPIDLSSLVDDVGSVPNSAGLAVVSFTPGEGGADGVLQLALSDGTIIDVAANEHGA
jgi:hypothetical protein